MLIRLFLVICVLALNFSGTAYAADTSRLNLRILPLECLTDVVDDGLNVYQFEEHPNCGHQPPGQPEPTNPEPPKEDVPAITYLNSSFLGAYLPPPDSSKNVNVVYQAGFGGLHLRQSVLRTVVISLSTISTLSIFVFLLRFF